jgi:2-(1,2-epoxy-1,2-dihydrophenyl)acetyl-CoA isomerase
MRLNDAVKDFLRVEQAGTIVHLTMMRNALNVEFARVLRNTAKELRADPSCAVVILAAEGPLFSGGGDLAAMQSAESPVEYVRELADTLHAALLEFAESDKVLVAAVHGPAAGAGFGIVLNCDYVVAADTATFVSAYSAVGLSPDCGVSYLLPRTVGPTRATEFVLLGKRLGAVTAREWGIVNAVVPANEVAAAAQAAAERIAEMPPASRAESKRLLAACWLTGYRAHLDDERDTIAALAGSDESARLRAAFLQ